MPAAVIRQASEIARIEQCHAMKVRRLTLEVQWLRDEIKELDIKKD